MSSQDPLPSDFDDVEMQDGVEQSIPNAPPPQPLFFASTPSAAGSPARLYQGTPGGMSSIMARRAIGMSTPKRQRTPLFARAYHVRACLCGSC